MAEGEIVNVRIERITAGGAGIARHEGKGIFVELTAPGDLARCRITGEHKNWANGELLQVLEPSEQRVEPLCPLFGCCGGCSLQHLNYQAQIEAKTAILGDAFIRIGGITPPVIRIRQSQPYEYRNRFRFHIATGQGGLGFKERKSSKITVIEDCPIADREIRKALKEKTLVPPPGRQKDRNTFCVYSRKPAFLREGGTEKGKVSILGRELIMDVGLFFQSNADMLELLIPDLLSLARKADKNLPIADIYCGVGTFASFLSDEFRELDLVEENRASLALARENLGAGKNVHYYPVTDTEWIQTANVSGSKHCDSKYRHLKHWGPNTWGFMVLDPPREGLSKPFREWLAGNGPDLVAYVSCDPATLARDSAILVKGGYTLKELTMYDFYPQTAHIESLAFFSRK